MANFQMSKEILDVINAVVYYGRFIMSHNYIMPKDGFDHFAEMEKYYHSLPLPEGMSKNRADFERILQIGWYSGKELERLNNLNYSDLRYESWKPDVKDGMSSPPKKFLVDKLDEKLQWAYGESGKHDGCKDFRPQEKSMSGCAGLEEIQR